jgi:hypothetical protein
MTTPRRNFLSWLGSASLLGAIATPSALRAETRRTTGAEDDTHAPPIAETWDMSWTSRLTGKYKAVFDSPEASDGAAMYRAVGWCEQYKEVYNAPRSDMSPVLVLRHLGFYLAMNDEFWDRFETGKRLKMRDSRGKKWARANPLGAASYATDSDKKFSIRGFQESGGIVLACGWSFGGAASMVAKADGLEREAARARAKELLIPGVILQPNGIFAALRAQEAGCSYVMAS